jgi:hypothetical protein
MSDSIQEWAVMVRRGERVGYWITFRSGPTNSSSFRWTYYGAIRCARRGVVLRNAANPHTCWRWTIRGDDA